MPYSFQPSFHKFKEICQLDPEIYQANGGKIDEEYYNKVLAYFDTSLDKIIQENLFLNSSGKRVYIFEKYYDRIYHSFILYFKDNQARKDNIKGMSFYANWSDLRPRLAGNEGTGIYWSGSIESCGYFKRKNIRK